MTTQTETEKQTTHTPGPWHTERPYGEPGSYISAADTSLICRMRDGGNSEANAARIVACVNACEGIDDPAELRSQRDALLAACEALIAELRDVPADKIRSHTAWDRVHSAIAKAR